MEEAWNLEPKSNWRDEGRSWKETRKLHFDQKQEMKRKRHDKRTFSISFQGLILHSPSSSHRPIELSKRYRIIFHFFFSFTSFSIPFQFCLWCLKTIRGLLLDRHKEKYHRHRHVVDLPSFSVLSLSCFSPLTTEKWPKEISSFHSSIENKSTDKRREGRTNTISILVLWLSKREDKEKTQESYRRSNCCTLFLQ